MKSQGKSSIFKKGKLPMDFGVDSITRELIAEEVRLMEEAVRNGNRSEPEPEFTELNGFLERIDEVHEPVGLDLSKMEKIGEDVQEFLHIEQGVLKVKRIIRPIYVAKMK